MSDFASTLGARIRELRITRGKSQVDVGFAMHALGFAWHQQTVHKIENGARTLSFEEALSLCRVLEVSLDQLSGLVPVDPVEFASAELALTKARDLIDFALKEGSR